MSQMSKDSKDSKDSNESEESKESNNFSESRGFEKKSLKNHEAIKKKIKKWSLLFSPLLLTLLILFGAYSYFKAPLEEFLLRQLSLYSKKSLPVIIEAQSFHFRFLSPGFVLTGLTIKANPKDLSIQPLLKENIFIQEVRGTFDVFSLLGGQIFLSSLIIDSAKLDLNIDAFLNSQKEKTGTASKQNIISKKEKSFLIDQAFLFLKKIPIYRLALLKMNLTAENKSEHWKADLKNVSMLIFNFRDKLSLQMELKNSELSQNSFVAPLDVQIDLLVSPQELTLSEFSWEAWGSTFKLNGKLINFKNIFENPKGDFSYQINTDLDKIMTEFDKRKMTATKLNGQINIKGDVRLSDRHPFLSKFEFRGENLGIANFPLGSLHFQGKLDKDAFESENIQIKHPSGDVKVNPLKIEFSNSLFSSVNENNKPIQLSAHLFTDFLDLNELLKQLNVGDIPLELFTDGEFDCKGPLYPNPSITCQGKAQGSALEVRSGDSPKQIILRLESEFKASGEVNINANDVRYKSKLQVSDGKPESQVFFSGESEGLISYEKGFQISYSTPLLNFSSINYLAALKLEGQAQMQGRTEGDSKHAVFYIDVINGKNIFFENYQLGDLQGRVRYEKGHLLFENFVGKIRDSNYKAEVDVNLLNETIAVQGSSEDTKAQDAVLAFSRLVHFPVSVSGEGRVSVKAEGPLKFNELSYDFITKMDSLRVAGENFQQLTAHFQSVKGEVQAKEVRVLKGKTPIELVGNGYPNGLIKFQVKGNSIFFEDLECISSLGSNISGLIDLDMELQGPVLSPNITLNLNVHNMILGDQEFSNSKSQLKFTPQAVEGKAELFGNELISNFQIPYDNKNPFYLKVKTTDWNFTNIFAILGGGALLSEYRSSITGELELSAATGGLFKSSGSGIINRFFMQRGDHILTNVSPMKFQINQGQAQLKNFRLLGTNAYIEILGENFSKENLEIEIKSELDLRLLQIFVPFLDDLSGVGKISTHLEGDLFKPEIFGTAQILNAYAKVKNFPHGIDKIQANVEFSHSKIMINDFKGILGGGNFSGDGLILFKGLNDFPTQVNAHIENTILTVPDHVRTQGSADITFSGNWFPFTLSGTYHVFSGLFDMEFDSPDKNKESLKQSSYLPKYVLKESFEPLLLDLQIILDRPLPVKNSMIDGAVSGNLQIKGPPNKPLLFGKLKLESPSKITFRDKIFDVQTGSVEFHDPKEINPQLYVSARSRVTDYDISILTQGTAKAPIIQLTSIPPLSEPDIVSLLAFGVLSSNLNQKASTGDVAEKKNQTALENSVAELFTKSLNKGLEQKLGVNLQITSHYDDTKNVAIQKFTIQRKLGEKVNASASQTRGDENSTELKLQYSINSEVSAVGSWENREPSNSSKSLTDGVTKTESIFGLDLEYKKEFK